MEDIDATVTHATIVYNNATNGGGVYTRTADILSMRNTVIAGSSGGDCVGGLISKSSNLIEDGTCSPAYFGEPGISGVAGSPGHFLLAMYSPAINRADPKYCLENDQIGTPRPQGQNCDIGAYESVTWPEPSVEVSPSARVKSAVIEVSETCSLSDAITAANSDRATSGCVAGGGGRDIIRLTSDITLEAFLPEITTEMVIEGRGYKISGAYSYRIFFVRFGSLTLENLTISKGYSNWVTDDRGGAIRVTYGKLTLSNCNFIDNRSWDAGAILAYDSDLRIDTCLFDGNLAEGGDGGALLVRGGDTIISNSVFSNNRAAENGGAIYAASLGRFQNGSVTIRQSTVEGNSAGGSGGGIYGAGGIPVRYNKRDIKHNEAGTGNNVYMYP